MRVLPTYEYQCLCGRLFEKYLSLSKRTTGQKCPSCDVIVLRALPSKVSGHFNLEVTGPVPQNTGASLDAHIDRVIGQSARQGKAVAQRRVEDKKGLLYDNPGTRPSDLSKNHDGSYRVMKPEESAAHGRSQKIHQAAMNRDTPRKRR